jgi:hypothetical protein
MGMAAFIVGGRQLRARLDCTSEVDDRGFEIAARGVNAAAADTGIRTAGIELDRPIVIGEGKSAFAAVLIGERAAAIGFSAGWIDADGLCVIGDGALAVAAYAIGVASIGIGAGIVRLDGDAWSKSSIASRGSPSTARATPRLL